ncbi:MAG TPA: hypothetical protein VGQ46_09975 [Thermoanaerobaculia bacterium]|nr:hypothetical protein [Thermoanaerobaculia bacterium]
MALLLAFITMPALGQTRDDQPLAPSSDSAVEQASGSIASNGTLSLVTWRERSGVQAVVRAAFIAADGQLAAPSDLGEADRQTNTATVSNGRDFLVVYTDPRSRLVARRVALEGVPNATPIVIAENAAAADSLAAGWSGQGYVVATAGKRAVTISGISADGLVAVSTQVISWGNAPADTPAVSCAANACNVTWHVAAFCLLLSSGCGNFTDNDILARTNGIGNVISQEFLTNAPRVTPALSIPASEGKSIFVYSNGRSMFAGRVSAAGFVLDAPLSNSLIMQSGTSFPLQPVAVIRNGLYLVELDDATNGRLYWSRIETEPTPRATSLVNLHQTVTMPLTLTASARNTYLVYSRGSDDPNLMAPRLFLRTIASPDPQTSPVRRHAAH